MLVKSKSASTGGLEGANEIKKSAPQKSPTGRIKDEVLGGFWSGTRGGKQVER